MAIFNSYVSLPEGTFGSLQASPMDHFEKINWTMVESFIQIHYPWLNQWPFQEPKLEVPTIYFWPI